MSIAREQFDRLTWQTLEEWKSDGEPETLHLEFKRKTDPATPSIDDEDRANLGKALSSFANVEGGLYVIGVDAGGGKGKTFDRVQRLEPSPGVEAFAGAIERRIRTFTDPPVAGLQVKAIARAPGEPGVVAIYVPESYGGPHRVTNATSEVNDRYYMRTAAGDQTMPHGLLADRFGRTARPRLRAVFELVLLREEQSRTNLGLRLTLHNDGRGAAIRPALLLRSRHSDRVLTWPTVDLRGVFCGRPTSNEREILYEPAAPSETVIYPGMSEVVATGPFNTELDSLEMWFGVTLFALDAQPVEATGTLRGRFNFEDLATARPKLQLPTPEE